ncbi:hypothetical protein OU995_04745 [Roseateles sp. SL47]|uniref:hypothetical protein n=1 Tax=Roseateles sp. SL47 TaxID=2995138 RepID=UPI00227142A8|nr:hypothetical protein [Roseateles sp. SL47]WAC74041.1 hypothetical protein OU995_04745 [Roseateles sp. SL47]
MPDSAGGTLLRAVVLNMGQEAARITDGRYDRYFKQGSASAGVAAVIAAGRFSINGLPIPASEADFRQRTPDGYQVNQINWLSHDPATGHWKAGFRAQKTAASYDAAALEVATGIVAGLEVRLYDTDGDRFADTIEADYKEGVQVQDIIRHADGAVCVLRGEVDTARRMAEEGRVFDGQRFTATSGERIATTNFDPQIKPGDVALFWWGPSGWVMQRAREVHGVFVDGSDHQSYTIDRTAYQDAMRFSRDNLFISNRPGEFVNAQKFFGLNGNTEGLKVSLWLVPTTDPMSSGAPVGMTSGPNARRFLSQALVQARRWLSEVSPSTDGTDVSTTQRWVAPTLHAQLRQAIARAQATMDAEVSTNSQLDYQVYLLYLTLHGSADDIGAKFGGYRQPGFIPAASAGLLRAAGS